MKSKLALLTSKIGSGITPRGGSSVYVKKGTFLIRSQNIYNDHFEKNGLVCITDETAEKMKGIRVYENDVLINITGDSVARTFIVPNEFLPARVNQHVCIIRANSNLNPFYLYYFLIEPTTQNLLLNLSGAGGTRKALTKEMLEELEIRLPDIQTQHKIVSPLKFLQSIQENLQKQNQILEQIIQSLFKSWFVDFDGQTEFVDSELGQIPKGWDIKPISFVCSSINYGYTTSAKTEEIGPRFLRITDIVKDWVSWEDVPFCEIDASDFKKYQLSNNDIVIARTGASTGDSKLIVDPPLSIFASYLIRLKIKSSFSPNYVASFISSKEYKNYINGVLGEKSAQPNANAKTLTACQMLIPSKELIKQFESICNALQNFIRNNQKKLENLEKIRDSLLPKLMSGELVN